MAGYLIDAKFIPANLKDPLHTPIPSEPGEFRFVNELGTPCLPPKLDEIGYIQYACLKNKGCCKTITIGYGFKPKNIFPSWFWNGSIDNITLSPILNGYNHNNTTDCDWFGWLRNGQFRQVIRNRN